MARWPWGKRVAALPAPEWACCPNTECRSTLAATVRAATSETLEAEPREVVRGRLKACLECGCMYVVAAGRVFRWTAGARPAAHEVPRGTGAPPPRPPGPPPLAFGDEP